MAFITFILSYNSVVGEELFICGDIPELGLSEENAIPLNYTEEGWKTTINISVSQFRYSYFVKEKGNIMRKEELYSHTFNIVNKSYKEIRVYDYFMEYPPVSKTMLSAVFEKSIMFHNSAKSESQKARIPIIFNTFCAQIDRDHILAMSGSDSFFGKWTEEDVREMHTEKYPEFHFTCDANKIFFPIEYKYVLLDKKTNSVVCWEEGKNRYFSPNTSLSTDLIIVNDKRPKFDLPRFKGAGVAIPIFSLRSDRGFGVGEFEDLKLMIDWAEKAGLKMIQTLPINDTTIFHTWKDSYPYSAISVFALHPMYLNIEKMGEIVNRQKYEILRNELNSNKFIDYESVNKYKWEFIFEIYRKDKNSVFQSKEYRTFYEENKNWLRAYAVFCFLRDKYNASDFSKWGSDAIFQEQRIEQYCNSRSKNYDSVAVHFFVQFYLHKQLSEVVAYAHKKGIALKGDIPIGVNRHSVDVWTNPELFDCNGQAGAPPDDFSRIGQNWGFPVYNWDEMSKDAYHWWKDRLKKTSEYFDAYRIDHILGFFRIFRIPSDAVWGLLGQFSPALPLSVSEIEKFGISFDEENLCHPFIHEEYLSEIFGMQTELVKMKYLISIGNGHYRLKEKVNTQKKIEKLFSSLQSEDDMQIKRGLMILVCQVLFVKDQKEKDKYHPRIVFHQSYAFRYLDPVVKEALNKLYVYYYYQRHDDFWKEQALKKLPVLIDSTNMLVCGEDLGMVPHCVPSVMSLLEILSLEIQRMSKEIDVEFGILERFPYLSVCTTSTHDMSTMRAWWEEDKQRTQRYFNNILREYGVAPIFCEPWVCQRIVEKHLHSPAMWAILPFQDWIAIDGKLRWNETFSERINDPSNPDNYWKYRMHLRLEDLLRQEEFASLMKSIILQSER